MTLKIHRNTGVSFKSHTPGRPRPCLEWCGREGQWETDICHFIFLINSWWVGKPGLEFHSAFPSLGVFDWLQGEHGIKSCSERNIRECKNILGFTKPKMGKRGWGRLSFPVFSSYSLLKWGLSDNRSECTRTGDTAARSVAGDGSRVVGLASFAALSWEKDLEYTRLFDTVIGTMACAPTGKFHWALCVQWKTLKRLTLLTRLTASIYLKQNPKLASHVKCLSAGD